MNPLIIRTDASTHIGSGHVMRCLALAQGWKLRGYPVTFLLGTVPSLLVERLRKDEIEVKLASLKLGSKEDAEHTVGLAKKLGAEWIVVDGYHFRGRYQDILKHAGLRVLFIDDYGHADRYSADLVLNQNLYAIEEFYSHRSENTRLLLGTSYVLLGQDFWRWSGWYHPIVDIGHRVLITLGGADPDNITERVIQNLNQVEQHYRLEIRVIVGSNNPHNHHLKEATRSNSHSIELLHNVTNMPELMAWADIAISAGGSTCWELAFMGVPSILLPITDHQVRAVQALSEAGAFVSLDESSPSAISADMANKLTGLLNNSEYRRGLSRNAQAMIDGLGVQRVLNTLID